LESQTRRHPTKVNNRYVAKTAAIASIRSLQNNISRGPLTVPLMHLRLELEIIGGLLHFLTGHDHFRQKLHLMHIGEDNMCRICRTVATPEHVTLYCRETENIAREERKLLGKTPVTELLRTPELVTVLRDLTNKISNFHKKKFLNGVDRPARQGR